MARMETEGAASGENLTPMMRQWLELKARAGKGLLFFRLGDFYELFEEDALTAAPVLGVTLTARNHRGTSNAASSPLCGVPVSNLEPYLTKALDRGFKIALAEQTEEPTPGKIIVRREIVQWFTPGIRLLKTDDRSHYAAVMTGSPTSWSLAAADVGTGHLVLESGSSLDSLQDLIDRLPVEDLRTTDPKGFELRVKFHESAFSLSLSEAEAQIVQSLRLASFADSPTTSKPETQALGTLLKILAEAHPRETLTYRRPHAESSHVWVSAATRRNLHLLEPQEKNIFTLCDKTQTAFGRRELKQILLNPTQDLETILHRQNLVSYLKKNQRFESSFVPEFQESMTFIDF